LIVVSDTSPLRALSYLGLLEVLGDLFEVILVPPAVVRELENSPARLPRILIGLFDFIHIQSPVDSAAVSQFRSRLDEGESEALALALEVGAEANLIDERAGRLQAVKYGIRLMGVLGILTLCKRDERIEAIGPLVERLRRETGFFVSEILLRKVLQESGELPE
jgi:predicted nucleic acid-binding protein